MFLYRIIFRGLFTKIEFQINKLEIFLEFRSICSFEKNLESIFLTKWFSYAYYTWFAFGLRENRFGTASYLTIHTAAQSKNLGVIFGFLSRTSLSVLYTF